MKYFIVPATAVLLTACASTGSYSPAKVKQMPASEFQAYLDHDLAQRNILGTPVQASVEAHWEDTQQKDCKIWASPDFRLRDPSVTFFWDGECRDGYAYGLGREFSIGKNIYVEAVGEYTGVKTIPNYYYEFHKNQKLFILGDLSRNNTDRLTLQRGLDNDNVVMNSINFEDFKNQETYRNIMINNYNIHSGIYQSAGGLAIVFRNLGDDPLIKEDMYIKFNGKDVYGFQFDQNGSKQFTDLRTSPATLTNPSENLKQFISNKLEYIQNELQSRHADTVNRFNLATKKVDQYINSACSAKPLQGIDKDTFYAICSPNKSLSLLQVQIDQGIAYANQQKLQRLEHAKQLAIKQQIAAQQAAHNARVSEENWLATLGAISSASNTIANSYYQRAQATNNMSNSMGQGPIYTVPNFGLNNRKAEFNCFSFGQSTNCKER